MPSKCILFYKSDRTDARAEEVIDREIAAGRVELLGVSAPEGITVPKERKNLPFYPPERLSTVNFSYAIVTETSAVEQRDRRRSRIKHLLPPALLRLCFKLSARLFAQKKLRHWKRFDGWGKPIARQTDMVFPEYSPLGSWGVPAEKTVPARTLCIPGFRMDEYAELRCRGITILSDNCWGGLMYHTLGMEMQSPFINMFINTDDFVKLLADLPHYLSLPLVPKELCVRRGGAVVFPVVTLGDIRLFFNHVSTPEELKIYAEKWYRRRDRMDMKNILVQSCFVNHEDQQRFESSFISCQYPKLIFTPYPDETCIYLSAFENNSRRYKGDFSACTRDVAKNDYPGEIPLDILQTLLTRTPQPPKEEATTRNWPKNLTD